MNFDFKKECKMNVRIITKNHEADPEIGFLEKSIIENFKAEWPRNGHAASVGVNSDFPT